MKRRKKIVDYEPEIKLTQMLAYRSDQPETHTPIKLINKLCELFERHPRALAGGSLHDYFGMDAKHFSYTIETLTGFTATELRAELIARRWHELKQQNPQWKEKQLSEALGFTDYSVMWQFIERHKHCFPEMYLREEERSRRVAVIVDELMCDEDAEVRRLFLSLPYRGGAAEEEACIRLLYRHGLNVARQALETLKRHPELGLDPQQVRLAALLHNIGIVWTNSPELHCHGREAYINHGILGRDWLSRKRLTAIGFAASYHLGAGITLEEIQARDLPFASSTVPRDALQRLICHATCFYSIFAPDHRRTVDEIRENLAKFGEGAVLRFEKLDKELG